MQVINKCARLITINFNEENYRLLPAGPAVEMPEEALEESEFLNILIEDKSVSVLGEAAIEEDIDPLADLRAEATELGVEKVTKNWGQPKLEAAIEEALAAAEQAALDAEE